MNLFSFQTIVLVIELKFSLEVPHPILMFWTIIQKRKKKSMVVTFTKQTPFQDIILMEFGGVILIIG